MAEPISTAFELKKVWVKNPGIVTGRLVWHVCSGIGRFLFKHVNILGKMGPQRLVKKCPVHRLYI